MEKITNLIKPILAFTIVILSFTYFFLIPKENPQILIAIVGMNSAIIGYYFGSTSGSAKKDETIKQILENK